VRAAAALALSSAVYGRDNAAASVLALRVVKACNTRTVQLPDRHIPNCKAYDPAYVGELAVIIDRGMREMLVEQKTFSTTSP
jgi:hypothetical protein